MSFQASQPSAKIFASRCEPELRAFIEVFHRWIQGQKLEGVLIDVADYSHVHHGPGVMLVAHEGYWSMDETGGQLGMFYKRRRGGPEDAQAALTDALRRAIAGAELIQTDTKGVTFATDHVVVGFEDRLHAPNDSDTFDALSDTLGALARRLFGEGATVDRVGDPRAPFRVRLGGASEVGLEALAARLG